MKKAVLLSVLRASVRLMPDTLPLLSLRTRQRLAEPIEYKSYDFFLSAVEGLVNGVYYGHMGGIFIDTLANLISGQLADAYMRAWADEGHFSELPDYLVQSLNEMILDQYGYVDQFYRDIVDARVDGTSIEPLLVRARMWANRYNEAYHTATNIMVEQNGGRLMWRLGKTEAHCVTCGALNGIVAYAKEWNELGVHPQGGPNALLICGGWQCDCTLKPTDKRRSPKAYGTILNAVNKQGE
jgi:hypothetical protein